MARISNETKAVRKIQDALNVQDLHPKAVAYMICMWTPSMQMRFWQICKEFMAQTNVDDVQIDIDETIRNW